MLNQSADYALRAVLFMAQQPDNVSCSADGIAEALGVPRNYLGKVLHTLVRAHVLTSVRGPRGGFRLARKPDRLTLDKIVEPFQQLPHRDVCLMGDRPCNPAQPCTVHQRWRRMVEPVSEFFRETTVEVMLRPVTSNGGHHDN